MIFILNEVILSTSMVGFSKSIGIENSQRKRMAIMINRSFASNKCGYHWDTMLMPAEVERSGRSSLFQISRVCTIVLIEALPSLRNSMQHRMMQP